MFLRIDSIDSIYSDWEEELCDDQKTITRLSSEELDCDDEDDDFDELELVESDCASFEHCLHGFDCINLFDGFPLSIQSSKSISSQTFLLLQYRLKIRLFLHSVHVAKNR